MAEIDGIREWRASHRFVRMSPTKIRRVADLVRHKPVEQALNALRFLPNRGARFVEQVLMSAVANAEDQGSVDVADLFVAEVFVNEGPRLKRIRPRARGSAYPIIKRLSHIHVTVA
jgi:large subunit ribosomal protein L22